MSLFAVNFIMAQGSNRIPPRKIYFMVNRKMCWNWQVSIGSFILISAVSYTLYIRNLPNDRLTAIFIMSYGLMQLFEALQWWGQNPGFENLNITGSFLGAILLYFHPLAIMIGLSQDKLYKISVNSPIFLLSIFASIGVLLYGIYRVVSAYKEKSYTFLSKPDRVSGHMVWESPDDYRSIMILISIIVSLYVLPVSPIIFFTWLLYFFLPIILINKFMKVSSENNLKNYTGSYWCWYVATFSFLFYFINKHL